MGFQYNTVLLAFFFLLAMCSPSALLATSRAMLDSSAHLPSTSTQPIGEVTTESLISLPPTSNRFNTLQTNRGKNAMEPAPTPSYIPASILEGCKPKGPVRWSAPSPIHNQIVNSIICSLMNMKN